MSSRQRHGQELSDVGRMVRLIVVAIVDHPEEVYIHEEEGARSSVIEINVDRDDVGKVIGKRGIHADAIRKLATAAGGKLRRRYVVEIIEDR